MYDLNNPVARLCTAHAAFLSIWGMDCPECARIVRQKLLSLGGVFVAEVYLEQRLASVVYEPGRVTPTDIVCAVDAAGDDGRHEYAAELISDVPAALALGI